MADLLDLSSRIIDGELDGDALPPINRVTNELSEIDDRLAMVESFSHSIVLDSGDGLVAFDASHAATGARVVEAIGGWRTDPVRHLVYTHGHADHVGGSPAFAAAYGEPEVIGHRNVMTRFDRYRYTNDWNVRINARQFGGVRGDYGMDGRLQDFIPPDTRLPSHIVDDVDTISVGGEAIELRHARGETDDHLWGWIPNRRWLFVGDFVIWNFPNAGNPQKVQRYPIEWAAALREMVALGPELMLPAHGLPVVGADRIAGMLTDIADALEGLVRDVVEMMNGGEMLDAIIHRVRVPEELIAKPYLRPLYDEPEFVVRNVWRQFGGWWDGVPSRLKPAPEAALAAELAELVGGAERLAERAASLAGDGDLRLACHFADLAGWAAPDDPAVHRTRAEIYRQRRGLESSLMSKGIFAGAARESEAIAEG
jgi:alkyl sulfatase BDS1-like metallo-beta-lactamase superfamily hydrolase